MSEIIISGVKDQDGDLVKVSIDTQPKEDGEVWERVVWVSISDDKGTYETVVKLTQEQAADVHAVLGWQLDKLRR